jgi:hypothetical protein
MSERYRAASTAARRALPVLLPRVREYFDLQRGAGGLSHDFSELKLLELAEFLWRARPQRILELGSGSTTAVFLEYASAFPDVRFTSVDESAEYAAQTSDRLRSVFQESIQVQHRDRIEEDDEEGRRVCFYDLRLGQDIDAGDLDPLYVDGPSARSRAIGELLPCVDAVRIRRNGHAIRDVLFDFRLSSVRYCWQAPEFDGYELRPHHAVPTSDEEVWVVGPARHHSWLSRRQQPPAGAPAKRPARSPVTD